MERRKADKPFIYGYDGAEEIQTCLACIKPDCTNCLGYGSRKGVKRSEESPVHDTGGAANQEEPQQDRDEQGDR